MGNEVSSAQSHLQSQTGPVRYEADAAQIEQWRIGAKANFTADDGLSEEERAFKQWRLNEEKKDGQRREERVTQVKLLWEQKKKAAEEKIGKAREQEASILQEQALLAAEQASKVKQLEGLSSTGHELPEAPLSKPIQPNFLQIIGLAPMPTVIKRPPVKSRFYIDDQAVLKSIRTQRVLHSEGVPITMYVENNMTLAVGDYVRMDGSLRFMRSSESTLGFEVTNHGQVFLMVFSFEEILTMGTGIGDDIMCDAATEAHCMYFNLKPPKKQVTIALETVDFRDALFICLVMQMAAASERHMEHCVTPNVSISIDMGEVSTRMTVIGVRGDNIEHLDYLSIQIPGRFGLAVVWDMRLVVTTRESVRIYKLPEGKSRSDCPGAENLSQSLQQYFVQGGFNDEIMAEMSYFIDKDSTISALNFVNVLHITPSQMGPNFVIVITYKINEDDQTLILKADDSVHRNKVLDGIYAAFKKRRRSGNKSGNKNKKYTIR